MTADAKVKIAQINDLFYLKYNLEINLKKKTFESFISYNKIFCKELGLKAITINIKN